MGSLHRDLADADLHRPGIVSDSSPGGVGAWIGWIRAFGDAFLWRVRNATNTGWLRVVEVPTVREIEDSAHTLEPEDIGAHLRLSDPSEVVLTIPADADVDFPVGATVWVEQAGDGPVTLDALSPAVVHSRDGMLATAGPRAVVALRKVDTDEWVAWGDLVS